MSASPDDQAGTLAPSDEESKSFDFTDDKLSQLEWQLKLEHAKRGGRVETTRTRIVVTLLVAIVVSYFFMIGAEVFINLSKDQRESLFRLISIITPMLSMSLGYYFAKSET
jgi:hypothetical protein